MPRKVVGGNAYNAAIKGAQEERRRISMLTERLSKPGLDNGNRHRLRAEILAATIRLEEHLDTLQTIGNEAKRDREEQ